MKDKFYITTAIAYTSKKPHIGNTYEAIFTDSIARYKRLAGYDVVFCTGTDEHGQKIEELAAENNITPKQHVDNITGEIKNVYKALDISYDKFIRTTDEYHEKNVQKIFKKLYEKGDIYKSVYEGPYCVPCRSFFTELQLKDGCCPDCGRPVEKTKEETYYLKLTKYEKQLNEYINAHPDFISPKSRMNEMVNNFIKPGLQDLCVSRTSIKWGIPVDFDPKHVVYVWLDALTNYISAIGYDVDNPSDEFKKYWPCDVHIIGKDILRFHTIYWPIMLMALDLPLPKKVFGHPWLNYGEDKMSKSKGNVIYADELAELFGKDAVRYYCLAEMPYAQDGSITYKNFISRYNTDLANTIGNLVNRSVTMVNKYFNGTLNKPQSFENEFDRDLIAVASKCVAEYNADMNEYKLSDAVEDVMMLARRSNKYIDETTPWVLAKDESSMSRLNDVLYNLIEAIRIIAVMLSPIVPSTSENIFNQINTDIKSLESINEFGAIESNSKVGNASVLFARADDAKINELKEKINKPQETVEKEETECNVKPISELISIDEFSKADIRVAKVLECEKVEKAQSF